MSIDNPIVEITKVLPRTVNPGVVVSFASATLACLQSQHAQRRVLFTGAEIQWLSFSAAAARRGRLRRHLFRAAPNGGPQFRSIIPFSAARSEAPDRAKSGIARRASRTPAPVR